jgi:hypothetical protein
VRRTLEYLQGGRERRGRAELVAGIDSGFGGLAIRSNDVRLALPRLDDDRWFNTARRRQALERQARQAHGKPQLRPALDRRSIGSLDARRLERRRREQWQGLWTVRHGSALAGLERALAAAKA